MDEAGAGEGRDEVTRRDLIRRGAALGAAAVWVAPTIQAIGVGRAFAQTASAPPPPPPPPPPPSGGGSGKGISFVAFKFMCNGVTYFAKLEGNTMSVCDGPNLGENCGIDQNGAISGCNLGLFSVENTYTNGEPTKVVVTLNCLNGSFLAAMSKAGGACFAASTSGSVATFTS